MSNQGAPGRFEREVKALAPLDDANWQKQLALKIFGPDDQDPYYQNRNYQTGADSFRQVAGRGKTLIEGGKVVAQFGSLVIADGGADVTAEDGSRVRANRATVEASAGSKTIAGDGAQVDAQAGAFVLGEDGSTTNASGAYLLLKSGARAFAHSHSHVVAEAGAQVVASGGSSVYLESGAAAIVSKDAHVSGPGAKNVLQMIGPNLVVAPAGTNNVGVPCLGFIERPDPNYDGYADYQREVERENGIMEPTEFSGLRLIVAKGAKYAAEPYQSVLTIAERGSNVTVGPGLVVAAPGSHVHVEKGGRVYTYAGADVTGSGEKTRLQGTYLGAPKDNSMLGLKLSSRGPYAVYQLPKGNSKPAPGFYIAPPGSKVEAGDGTFIEAFDGSKIDAYSGSSVLGLDGSETLAHDGSHVVLNPGAVTLADAGSDVSVHLHGIAWAQVGAKVDARREWTGEEDLGMREYREPTVVLAEPVALGLLRQAHILPAKPGTFQELDNLVREELKNEAKTTQIHEFMEKATFGLDWIRPYEDLNH